jgi:hypothetical protein
LVEPLPLDDPLLLELPEEPLPDPLCPPRCFELPDCPDLPDFPELSD